MSFTRTKLRMAHASILLLTKNDKPNETQLATSTATPFEPPAVDSADGTHLPRLDFAVTLSLSLSLSSKYSIIFNTLERDLNLICLSFAVIFRRNSKPTAQSAL